MTKHRHRERGDDEPSSLAVASAARMLGVVNDAERARRVLGVERRMNLLSSHVVPIPGHGVSRVSSRVGNVITARFARTTRAEPRIDPNLPRKAKIRIRGPYFLTYNLDRGGRLSAAPASNGESEAPKSASSAEGVVIADRYELVSQVGVGGMGIVWRARDRRLGRAVAVKVLSSVSLGNDIARTRLIREARAAAALEHDGIIRVYDVGETPDGGAFLVMELIRGRSLRAVIEERTAKLGTITNVIVKAARALQFAHDAGIVHRDMKPDNIMICDDGRVTVVDFGVAKPIATADIVAVAGTLAGTPAGGSLTGSGMLVGTPAYLAPEQARGQPVGPATDQFALAVTAYEALTGGRPWTGSCFSEVIASLLRDAPPPVSSVVDVPKAIDEILARAMAKEPDARWEQIGDFANALEDAAQVLETDPVPSARGAPSRRITPTDPAKPASRPQEERESQRTLPVERHEISGEQADPLIRTGDDAPSIEKLPVTPPERSRRLPWIAGAGLVVLALVSWYVVSQPTRVSGPAVHVAESSSTATGLPAASREAAPVAATSAPVVETVPVSSATPNAMPLASTPPTAPAATVRRAPSATTIATTQPRASASAKPSASNPGPASTPSSTGRRIRTDL